MKNKKLLATLIVFVIEATSVYAYNLCQARDVVYFPKDTSWNVSNVQEAISDLYKDKCGSANACGDIAEPKFYDDEAFIPVTIDDDGTVRRADTTTSWYDYCEKRWANAVMLNKYRVVSNSSSDIGKITIGTAGSNTGYLYTNDETVYTEIPEYKPGEVIKERDIQSYFVWIPKYKYKLWNVNSDGKSTGVTKGVHSIDIVFEKTDTTDVEGVSCATPLISGESGKCNNGEYMTHPAFISANVDGFWVAKYETSATNLSTIATGSGTLTAIGSSNTFDRTIAALPLKTSVVNVKFQTLFENAYNYARAMESHMMKNTEWGAVAYLSHSKYGINKKINLNNYKSINSGYSALPSTNQQTNPGTYGDGDGYNETYNTEIGYLASTTGNITGIYDLVGGAQEYVASYIDTKFGSSGFKATTIAEYDAKYFDVYNTSSTASTFKYRILGDATGETGPFKSFIDGDGDTTATTTNSRNHNTWYNSLARFVLSSEPFFLRGGTFKNGGLASQFYFDNHTGAAHANVGYRFVLF